MTGCPEQCCATCRFWERQGPPLATAIRDPRTPADQRVCQSRAPVVVVEQGRMTMSLFPLTHETRYCGDWMPVEVDGGPDDGERVIAFPLGRAANRIAA
jgi:hypothetical protein